jgi:hypothetical protein
MQPQTHSRSSFTIITIGVVMELAGLGLDVGLHLQDESLAAREGVLTLTNPGHLLFGIGPMLTVLGLVLHFTQRWFGPRRQTTAMLTTISVVSVLTATGAVAAWPKQSHLHVDSGPEGVITYTAQLDPTMSWAEWEHIDRQLTETKAATARFADVAVAEAAGYHQEGQSLRGAGAHFINRAILDAGIFDHTRPTFLL